MSTDRPMQPEVDRTKMSADAKLALDLADVFYEAALTDCYVTTALVTAIENGIALLTVEDFTNVIMDIHNESVVDRFLQITGQRQSQVSPDNEGTKIVENDGWPSVAADCRRSLMDYPAAPDVDIHD